MPCASGRNKLELGNAGRALVLLAQQEVARSREERARERARRRHEEQLRLGEAVAAERRMRRLRAMRSALQEYAAGDFITRVARASLARSTRRKLRLKQSAFLRGFAEESTGCARYPRSLAMSHGHRRPLTAHPPACRLTGLRWRRLLCFSGA